MFRKKYQDLLREIESLPLSEQERIWNALSVRLCPELKGDFLRGSKLAEARFGEGLRCPRCNCETVVRYGTYLGRQRYRCKNCLRTFNALTGTPLEKTQHLEKWPLFLKAMRDGLTIHKTAELVGISPGTTFRWRHKVLHALRTGSCSALNGIVEADETFCLRSEKGSRNLNRPPRKRGEKAKRPGRSREQVCVVVSRDRSGRTVSLTLDTLNQRELQEYLGKRILPGSTLCTDGLNVYQAFARSQGLKHRPVNISKGRRVREEIYHIQNVNAFHSRLWGWMSRFRGVATKYLQNYLRWFEFVDDIRKIESRAACELLFRESLRALAA